eukprot:12399645-Alexandrium_andersonii.AAC.1
MRSRACAPSSAGASTTPRAAPARRGGLRTSVSESFGYARGRASSCCFYNAELDVRRVARRGDFTFT